MNGSAEDGPAKPAGDAGAVSEDRFFGGALRLRQVAKGHRAGTDAVLLAAATPPEARRIADLGAASGVVGLRAAQLNPRADICLIEREPLQIELAKANIALNGLGARVTVLEADILAPGARPDLRETFDCVLTNPPFWAPGAGRVSPDAGRARAHVLDGALDDWIRRAMGMLAPKGQFIMIHRADAIGEILAACQRRLGAISLRFVHPAPGEPAIRVLVAGIKGSRGPLAVLPPLVLHAPAGDFTPEAQALHEGHARVAMGGRAASKGSTKGSTMKKRMAEPPAS